MSLSGGSGIPSSRVPRRPDGRGRRGSVRGAKRGDPETPMTVEPRILTLKTLVAALGYRSGGSHNPLVAGSSPRWAYQHKRFTASSGEVWNIAG